MTTLRVKKNQNYSVISNVHLQDHKLSWKAKGLLSYLLSKTDDWQIYIEHLKNQSKDGRDATRTGINELIKAGYITKTYKRNEAGQIIGREYIVHENPVNTESEPKTDNPTLDNPTLENPTLPNTDSNQILKNDDVKAQKKNPPKPAPKSKPKEPNTKPSSSFSTHNFNNLLQVVPQEHRTKTVQTKIRKKLKDGYSVDYIGQAIEYTTKNSNGSYAGYLGNCIDKEWHVGEDPQENKNVQEEKHLSDMRKKNLDNIKIFAAAGNKYATAVLKEMGEV